MASLFSKLSPWLASMRPRIDVSTVTYTRGTTTLTISATPGAVRQPSELVEPGVVLVTSDRDYLIAASDLTFGEPVIGDRITETINGVSETYEVKTPGDGRKAWEWHDRDHTTYRVHTLKVI